MLTPQEAESHVFPKASFGGYNMLQVDAFLDSLIGITARCTRRTPP